MSNTTTSPNMLLPVPVVGTDPGPDWANNLNACLGIIDQHNHAAGSGVQITPSGLNINSDLSFNSNNMTAIRSAIFTPQTTTLSTGIDVGNLYTVTSGGQTNLYYNNGSGTPIPITSGNSVNAGAGSITGLPSGTASVSFAAATYVFQSATNTPATVDGGSFIFRNLTANSYGVTVSPPNSLAANSNLVLPAVPGAQSFLSIDASGNIAAYEAVSGGITGSNIAAQTITATNIANQTITATQIANSTITTNQVSNSANINSGQLSVYDQSSNPFYATSSSPTTFTTSSTSFVHVTGLDTSWGSAQFNPNRPVFITFVGAITVQTGSSGQGQSINIQIRWVNGLFGGSLYQFTCGIPTNTSTLSDTTFFGAGCINSVDLSALGATGYQVWIEATSASGGVVGFSGAFLRMVQV